VQEETSGVKSLEDYANFSGFDVFVALFAADCWHRLVFDADFVLEGVRVRAEFDHYRERS
jgi:hypothetical protein